MNPARSRIAPCMVVTDVEEVVEAGREGDEYVDELVEDLDMDEPLTRFDKIKEAYKGVTSAIDVSEETGAYESFDSLLYDHKVGALFLFLFPSLGRCLAAHIIIVRGIDSWAHAFGVN